MDNELRPAGKSADIMTLVAAEAEHLMVSVRESACKEAIEETEKLLRQYEQKAKQIILKTREEARAQANQIAERFREALLLRIEEASTTALSQIMAGVGAKTGDIVAKLQDVAKHEIRQALTENIVTSTIPPNRPEDQVKPLPAAPAPVKDESVKVESAPGQDFESWLRQ